MNFSMWFETNFHLGLDIHWWMVFVCIFALCHMFNQLAELSNSTDLGEPTATTFSDLAGSAANQLAFSNSLISFMSTYGFDGVDIDWYVIMQALRAPVPCHINFFQGISCSSGQERQPGRFCQLPYLAFSATGCLQQRGNKLRAVYYIAVIFLVPPTL